MRVLKHICLILFCLPALSFARGDLLGYCTQGGQVIQTSSVPSTTKVMQSYPQCSVTVYYSGGPAGTVTTSGTTVTWSAGTLFNSNSGWPGLTITINSVTYTIQSVATPTSLTLTSSAGTQASPVVYTMGSTAPAAIYDSTGTAKTNPFASSLTGLWQFYADNGKYDIRLSGGGIPAPFTWSSQDLIDPLTLPNTVSDLVCTTIGCLSTLCTTAAARHQTLLMSRMWDLNGTCAASIEAFSGGGFAPSSGHVTTLSGTFNGDLTQHFNTTAAGAGSVLLTGKQETIPVTWFGAVIDGTTSDYLAWTSSLAALPNGGSVLLPSRNGSCSLIDQALVLPAKQFHISGAGREASILCGTGFTIITTTAFGQVLENIGVSESNAAGSVNTVGISIGDGTNDAVQGSLINVKVLGKSPGGFKGIGIKCNGSTQVLLQGVTSAFWNYGLQLLTGSASPCNALTSVGSSYIANAARQISDNGGGDITIIGGDIENGPVGIYLNGAQLSVYGTHFEAGSLGTDLDCHSGTVQNSSGNRWIGGFIILESGCNGFTSYGDYLADNLTLNNNTFNAQVYNPFLIGGVVTAAPTGSMAVWSQTGEACLGACSATNSYTFAFPYISIPILSPVSITGTLAVSGETTITAPLVVSTLTSAFNQATECTGAGTGCSGASGNNALTAKWTKPNGTLVTLAVGQMFYIPGATHTLQAGANTLNLNNTGAFAIHTLQKAGNLTSTWTNGNYYFVVAAGEYFLIGAQ